MARSPSAEQRPPTLTAGDADLLLDLAEGALRVAFGSDLAAGGAPSELPGSLLRSNGVFVTILVGGRLNGCIGEIEGTEPLASAVPRLAVAAAFDDPRLPPLRADELAGATIELSLLSSLVPIAAGTRAELLAAIRRDVDGLVIAARGRRALFLPSVWSQLPAAEDFVDQLIAKAGLPAGRWPADLRAFRFQVERHERHVDR